MHGKNEYINSNIFPPFLLSHLRGVFLENKCSLLIVRNRVKAGKRAIRSSINVEGRDRGLLDRHSATAPATRCARSFALEVGLGRLQRATAVKC